MIYKKNVKPQKKLQKKNTKKKMSNDMFFQTTTKLWITVSMTVSWICVIWSYVLATFGKDNIAVSLSNNIVKVIISSLLLYMLKSFAETYCEKRNINAIELLKLKHSLGLDISETSDTDTDVECEDEDEL